jgi:hypothetical protein
MKELVPLRSISGPEDGGGGRGDGPEKVLRMVLRMVLRSISKTTHSSPTY